MMTRDTDTNDTARQLVVDQVETCITDIEQGIQLVNSIPPGNVCSGHSPLVNLATKTAKASSLVLQMQVPVYKKCSEVLHREETSSGTDSEGNWFSFKGLKVSGKTAVESFVRAAMLVGIAYLILRGKGL